MSLPYLRHCWPSIRGRKANNMNTVVPLFKEVSREETPKMDTNSWQKSKYVMIPLTKGHLSKEKFGRSGILIKGGLLY